MFWHLLAKDLGKSVDEAMACIDSPAFARWIAFYELMPPLKTLLAQIPVPASPSRDMAILNAAIATLPRAKG